MTSYLPDNNVWLALSWEGHRHSAAAWRWFRQLTNDEVLYCRITQLGLLRLLTTKAVMDDDCLTINGAWAVNDQWLRDPKVLMRPESAEVDSFFRRATLRFAKLSAPKILGDCYLLAVSGALDAKLVSFDTGFVHMAQKAGQDAIQLG